MITKEELHNVYQQARTQTTSHLRACAEKLIDETLLETAKSAKPNVMIDIIKMIKPYAPNIDEETVVDVARALILDYADVITVENIEDVKRMYDDPRTYSRYNFIIDQELYNQRYGVCDQGYEVWKD